MGRKDYEHWNEDADHMWWMEEGRFASEPDEIDYDSEPYDDPDDDDDF